MPPLLTLILASLATVLATGLGAVPVFFLGERAAEYRAGLLGFAVGIMGVAAVLGLLVPAIDEGGFGSVAGGLVAGLAFLLGTRTLLERRKGVSFAGMSGGGVRTSILVFAVLLVHSLPEGMAMGSAYASEVEGLALFVILAIALQNIPEGTAVAVPMSVAGYSPSKQFWAATTTSLPQPFGAVLAYVLVEEVAAVLPFSLAFAAGAMLTLIVVELIPETVGERRPAQAVTGAIAGAAIMVGLSLALGVS